MFFVSAIQTRKNARAQLPTKAMATAPTMSTTRRKIDNRFNSPKSRPIMSDVCNERTPLHASLTPTSPLGMRIRLPSRCAGIPNNAAISLAIAATICIKPCTTGTSIGVTHGTATNIKRIGNAKCRSQGVPPLRQTYKSVRVATMDAWTQLSGRQSGFPISKRRTGRSKRSAAKPISAAIIAATR